jgi:hypothetical protein
MASITRGRLTIVGRGITRAFMFNPNEINDTKGIKAGSNEVPGISHPVAQFGAGSERNIKFELHLDGDRGKVARGHSTLSIANEIHFYQSLEYPGEYHKAGMQAVFPYLVLFTFGELYQRVPCLVRTAGVKVIQWTPKLEPQIAKISMHLTEIVDKSKTARDIFPDEDGGLVDDGPADFLTPAALGPAIVG